MSISKWNCNSNSHVIDRVQNISTITTSTLSLSLSLSHTAV
jgi:hypothetical protein